MAGKDPVDLVWPFQTKAQTQFARVDQGWDLQTNAGGNIYCVASGTLKVSSPDPGGFGNDYPVVIVDSPIPAGWPSDTIYYGHVHTIPGLNGKHVTQGQLIATANATDCSANDSACNGSLAPFGWLEIGFAQHGNGAPVAPLTSSPSTPGAQMKGFLVNAGLSSQNVLGGTGTGGTGATGPGPETGTGPVAANAAPAADTGIIDTTLANFQDASKQNISDPRSNLPFSAYFSQPAPLISSGPKTGSSNLGGFGTLVRGGMSEINNNGNRPGGNLALYFMMNPAEIDQSYTFDQSIPIPTTLSPDIQAISKMPLQNQSISFTLFFNRMYEVWNGDVKGPSEIGVRWDIRALERLMGLLDGSPSTIGLSSYSAGQYAPVGLPVQIVMGGSNSFQFQGLMQDVSVQYTRFDRNMIPVEAIASVNLIKVFIPPKGQDLVSGLAKVYSLSLSGGPVPAVTPLRMPSA